MKKLITTLLIASLFFFSTGQNIDSTKMVPYLEADSNYYINLCYGDTLNIGFLDGGVYTWVLSGETLQETDSTLYTALLPGAWTLSVENPHWGNSFTFRIRAGEKPDIVINPIPPLCAYDCFSLTYGGIFSTVFFDTIKQKQETTLGVSDMVFLPDGQDCGNGCAYISSVQFSGFSPTATLTNASDILYCMVDIEHSYIGDIWIALTCPNGQRASLLKKYGTGSSGACYSQIPQSAIGWSGTGTSNARFGIANTNDNSANKCDPNTNPPGTCWEYYWSNNPTYTYYNNQYVYTNATGAAGVPGGFYHPDDNFANLIGCPLNGDWSIQVMDGWGIDNGWLCGWELALNPDLIPQDWGFDQYITDAWTNEGDCVICPDSTGNYDIFIQDNLGCNYDTFIVVQTVNNPAVDLGPDIELCFGDVITLIGPENCNSYHWNTGDTVQNILVVSAGEYILEVENTEYGLTCSGKDTVNVIYRDLPNANFDISDSVGCAPMQVCLYPEYDGLVFYVYKDGVLVNILNGHSNFILENPGIYSIQAVSVDDFGCVYENRKDNSINVLPSSEAGFEYVTNGLSVQFSNYSIGDSFLWSFGDGESSTEESPEHIFRNPGDYPVTILAMNQNGCIDSVSRYVCVEIPLEFPNVITPNEDNVNDIFAIKNLVVSENIFFPRRNNLRIYDRWGKLVYHVNDYDTYGIDNEIFRGSKYWPDKHISDGVYFFDFEYFGIEHKTYHGSITIIR